MFNGFYGYSTIGGGWFNTNFGSFSSILGGRCNRIPIDCAHTNIIGSNIVANRSCTTFVNDLSVCSFTGSSGCSICVGSNGLLVTRAGATNGSSGTSGASGTSGSSGTSGIAGSSGTSGVGVSGSSGTSGANGIAGTSGISGSSGTSSGGGGSTPIKLTGQTLTAASWTLVSGYYTYSFSDVNITANCDVSVTPENASYLTAYNAQVLPYVGVASGVATFYSQFPPDANMTVDIIITQTT